MEKIINGTNKLVVQSNELIVQELDGKRIAYHKSTVFLVQVGKGPKGSYQTKYKFVGNLTQAVMYYNGINLNTGHKKRLLMPSSSRNPVLSKSSQLNFSFFPKRITQISKTVLTKSIC